jgi:hypothetical protein
MPEDLSGDYDVARREQLAAEAGYAQQDADRLLKQHDRAKTILGEALEMDEGQIRACRIEELAGIAAARLYLFETTIRRLEESLSESDNL